MKNSKWSNVLVVPILLAVFLLTNCAAPAAESGQNSTSQIRFAALRILDSLPLYVAEEQGYFTEAGVSVTIIPVNSAAERDQLIASNQADGMINEVMSTLFANREEVQVVIVRTARAAEPDSAVFRVLAAGNTGVNSIAGLQSLEIGISQGTIIEYVTDRLFEAEGFDPTDFNKVNIPAIPDRLALLNSGELGAATLPEPASTLATAAGAIVVIDDSAHPEYGYSTIAFRQPFVEASPSTIRAFLEAIEKAVDDINQNPEQWSSLLVERGLIPEPLAGNYPVPSFIEASVPSENQFQDAVDWARSKNLISSNQSYADQITSEYLP